MSLMIFSVILISIILLAGVIGGFINHLSIALSSSSTDNGIPTSPIDYSKHLGLQILLGVAGASLIPLLLHLTSSKLFDGNLRPLNFFIFGGYCIIGAIFSQSLLNSLAKRLDLEKIQKEVKKTQEALNSTNEKLKEAESRAKNAEERAETLETETDKFIKAQFKFDEDREEDEVKGENIERIKIPFVNIKDEINNSQDLSVLDDTEKYILEQSDTDMMKILHYLQNSTVINHSPSGISRKTGVLNENTEIILRTFARVGILIPVTWFGKISYRLTSKGRDIIIE